MPEIITISFATKGLFVDLYLKLLVAVLVAVVSLRVLYPLALRYQLVDIPDSRKHHKGNIPLIGGVSVFIGSGVAMMLAMANGMGFSMQGLWFWGAAFLMVLTGVVDDKHDLSVRTRVVIQVLVASSLVFASDVAVHDLGYLFGAEYGSVELGAFAGVFTVIAIMGLINAFNMVDGMDGLLGALSMVTLLSIAILNAMAGQYVPATVAIVVCAAIVPFMVCNVAPLRFRCPKVFMGDAGSMFIGLTVVWLVIISTQGGEQNGIAFRPVTALWLVALPLMDMVAIMFRRMKKGQSPFRPDREHLHHLFMRSGFGNKQALGLISLKAIALASIGIAGEIFAVPESYMFAGFLLAFVLYCIQLIYAWKITTAVRRARGLGK